MEHANRCTCVIWRKFPKQHIIPGTTTQEPHSSTWSRDSRFCCCSSVIWSNGAAKRAKGKRLETSGGGMCLNEKEMWRKRGLLLLLSQYLSATLDPPAADKGKRRERNETFSKLYFSPKNIYILNQESRREKKNFWPSTRRTAKKRWWDRFSLKSNNSRMRLSYFSSFLLPRLTDDDDKDVKKARRWRAVNYAWINLLNLAHLPKNARKNNTTAIRLRQALWCASVKSSLVALVVTILVYKSVHLYIINSQQSNQTVDLRPPPFHPA